MKSWSPGIVVVALLSGCSLQSAETHFLRAERLWAEKKYLAAVKEYDRVGEKAPKSKLGTIAQYRAARTEMLFLENHESALKRLQRLHETTSEPIILEKIDEAISELLGPELGRWDEALEFYSNRLASAVSSKDKNKWRMRKGSALSHLQRYREASEIYDGIRKDPNAVALIDEATWRYSVALFQQSETRGLDRLERERLLKQAALLFESIERGTKNKSRSAEAAFLVANCFEELDRVNEAIAAYERSKADHPNPPAVEVRIQRLKERISSKKG